MSSRGLEPGRKVLFIRWPNGSYLEFDDEHEARITGESGHMAWVPYVKWRGPTGEQMVACDHLDLITLEDLGDE